MARAAASLAPSTVRCGSLFAPFSLSVCSLSGAGGRTWSIPRCAGGASNDTTFSVLAADGKSMHNMGDVVGVAAAQFARRGNLTAVSANASTVFTLGSSGGVSAPAS